jgi:acyl transferase domain-containing protein/NADP-dependent 3-hydroxy acid dehydrogenase YdfG/acyl carrier protein
LNTETANTPLAIVGIGCLFPKAAGPGFFWANVKHGVDCIGPVPPTHWDPADYFDADPKRPDMTYAQRGGFLDAVEFDPLAFGIAPRDIEATDTTQLLGLVAAKQALTDAGVVLASGGRQPPVGKMVDRDRVSVILGVTGTLELVIQLGARLGHPKWKRAMKDAGVPDDVAADAADRIAESYVPWQENSFPGLLGNVVAGRIANKLDLGGTNCVVDAACASSLSAVHLAALELQTSKADVVVTGGADTFNDIFMFMCFSKTPALSPTGDAKPFDAKGDGTILGEGLGMVVLKRLADAERDGDTVYAVLRGIGSSSDGKGNAIYAPSAAGQKKCLLNAYRQAGVTPDTIELVEAHGTGTKVGDTVEITALTDVYTTISRDAERSAPPKPRPWCAIGSVKSQIGHTKAAAGAASLIKAALALHFKVLPPTAKVTDPVDPLKAPDSPFYVSTEMRPWLPRPEHPRRAALSAFGFGGSNFHAVLEEHGLRKAETDWDGSVEIVALSADAPDTLAAEVAKVPADWTVFARFAEASRSSFHPDARHRLCFAAHRELTDRPKLLAAAKERLKAEPAAAWSTPDGAHYGVGSAPGSLAVLFPGQGSQAVGMLRHLACTFPEVLDSLAAANQAVAAASQDESDARRLSDRVYPPATFDPERKAANDRELRDTRHAQPAIGAVSYGAWKLLADRFGLTAAAFAGHSYGELVALAAAGRFAPADLFALSRLRGQLMAEQRAGDPGAMLAVLAPLGDVEAVLARERLQLVVANKNAPQQAVLSGATAEVERAAQAFAAAKMKAARLSVAAAFHSEFVADAAGPFRAALDGTPLAPASVPVYANTTAAEYPADAAAAKDLLANQLARPVAFVDEVRALAAAGARTFLEVGPGSVLTKLATATLDESGISGAEAVALDASGGRWPGVLDLGNVLARLSARGHPVRLSAWEAGGRCRPAPAPSAGHTVPICGANYVSPRSKRPPRPAAPSAKGFTMSDDARPPADAGTLAQALRMTQQSLAALQRMQEQAAALHRHFLEQQEAAQRTLQALVEQQAVLLSGVAGGLPLPPLPPLPQLPPIPVPANPVMPRATPQAAAVTPKPTPAPVSVNGPKPAAAAGSNRDRIGATLLEVVAEKTGYPVSSLSLTLSLDSDLGVDSIKRVEILSTLREKLPAAPEVKPEHLGTLHTLQDVADFFADTVQAVGEPACTPPAAREDVVPLAAAEAPGADDVGGVLLEVVAEKTGYPVSSLNLDLSMDSDLGVDSIKRVEILSAIREKLPGSPEVKPEHLGTLHTLRDVAAFLADHAQAPSRRAPLTAKIPIIAPLKPDDLRAGVASASELAAPKTEQVSAVKPVRPTESALGLPVGTKPPSGTTKTPTRPTAPADTHRQPIAPLGADRIDRSILQAVDLDPNTPRPRVPLPACGEVWVVGEPGRLTESVVGHVAGAGYKAKALGWSNPGAHRPAGPLAGLVLIAPVAPGPDSGLNRLAFEWLQQVGPKLRQTGRTSAAVLATVARLDGVFGLNTLSADADPTAGGLAGIVKTARHEWPEVTGKAIDLSPDFTDVPAAAAAVADEVLTAGPMEVGIAATHRCTLELARTVRRAGSQTVNLGTKDVILVTGGARGVTAEAAVALAETYAPTLVLTGRTPAPGPEPEYLAGVTAEAEVKKAIASKLGPDAGPKAIGEQYQKVTAQREVRETLRRIEAGGGKAAYYQVDVADGRAVADLLQKVRVKFGPVTAVVHGAGVLADRRIEDLTPEQFDTVYATKVEGLRNLLDLLGHEDLKTLVLFSSTTARLGRTGQVAYAAANEVLNKTAQVEARRRPGCRVVSVNWGPWEGGMVTPALKKLFEAEGVGLIPLADGAAFLVNELNAAGRAVEVVALGKFRSATGSGVQPVPGAGSGVTPTPQASGSGVHPMPGAAGPLVSPPNVVPAADLAVAFERDVDIATHPILKAHVIDGKAVLPMALHLEWLAHAALHGHPGLVFHGFNDLRVTQAVHVDAEGAVHLRAFAGKAVKQDKLYVVPVELRGRRKDGREMVKSRAEIVLVSALPKAPPADRPPAVAPVAYSVEQAYQEQLFHGPDLHGIDRIDGAAEMAFIGTATPAPPPADWLQYPPRSGWVADPLVLDASFQMMILWSQARHGAGSIPSFAGRYRQFRRSFPQTPVQVVIRVTRDNGTFARADIDYLDADGQVIAQMQDYECVMQETLNQAFRRNQLGAVKA